MYLNEKSMLLYVFKEHARYSKERTCRSKKKKNKVDKDGNGRFRPTGNVLIETPVAYILKTEQPVPLICHNKLPLKLLHYTLSLSTIAQKPHNILVLGIYQAFDLFMKFVLVKTKCVGQLLYGDHTFSNHSLQ
jgi:hypothetical protein